MINDVLALSIFLVAGYVLGLVLERIRLPALIGYILVGFVLGPPVLGFVTDEIIADLDFVSIIALGLIAFIIGGRIKMSDLRSSRNHMLLMAGLQALVTFVVITAVVYPISGSLPLALVLGAIGTATAPAAIFGVIEEYKAKGPVTRSLLSIVAIDDAICLTIFGIVVAGASILAGGGVGGALEVTWHAFIKIVGALGIGAVSGLIVVLLVRTSKEFHHIVYVAIGFVFLGTGLAQSFEFSELLTNMVAGFVVTNYARHAERLFALVEKAEDPILIIFFALAGAGLKLASVIQIWPVFVGYILARTAGKIVGGSLAGWAGTSSKNVRRYLGLGLLPQAGVAIGLIYVVQERIPQLGGNVVAIILGSTLVFAFIGPVMAEIALFKSREATHE